MITKNNPAWSLGSQSVFIMTTILTQANLSSQNFQHPCCFTIDQSAALAHLKALGYEEGESIYLRALPNSRFQGRAINLEGKFPLLPWSKLESFQHDGKGIYFVVNGGGHKDADVALCRAVFYEHDNLPKEQQLVLWRDLKLPQPTIQVDTGGKSMK